MGRPDKLIYKKETKFSDTKHVKIDSYSVINNKNNTITSKAISFTLNNVEYTDFTFCDKIINKDNIIIDSNTLIYISKNNTIILADDIPTLYKLEDNVISINSGCIISIIFIILYMTINIII